jgi:MYXO-CTERM domain-containing protein
MKMKLTLATALLVMASNVHAASYVALNAVSGTSADVLIENVNGTLSSGGIVAIGHFTGGAPSSNLANIATTISNFQLQASALTGGYSASLEGAFAGYYEGTVVNGAQILTGNPLIGQGVYLFAGNAATLAASTAWALVQVGTYIADNPPLIVQYTANAKTAVTTPASIVFGTVDTAPNPIAGTSSTLKLVAAPIPEPSAALLGALGALGLLRRRRN